MDEVILYKLLTYQKKFILNLPTIYTVVSDYKNGSIGIIRRE